MMKKDSSSSFFNNSKRGLNLDGDDIFADFPISKPATAGMSFPKQTPSNSLPLLPELDTKPKKKTEEPKKKEEDNPFSFFKVSYHSLLSQLI
jgi:hypothetical protein